MKRLVAFELSCGNVDSLVIFVIKLVDDFSCQA